MTDLKLKLTIEISGAETMHEIDDRLTMYVGDRIQSRIVANPNQAVNAQNGSIPQGLTIKPLVNVSPVINETVNKVKSKSSFEEA